MMHELIVDSFAGGGGASLGIEWATGRSPDIAINHDAEAIALHAANHPASRHFCEDVWRVDPHEACAGRSVGLMWLSPDCKHFSKAKGGKPVEKKVRGLAWVAVRWAKAVQPRVIVLENVEEFQGWGPVDRATNRPCPVRKGLTFRRFVGRLRALGYAVEWRELRACDYGTPTTRKRLFLVARRDGQPIVWPKPTHGKGRPTPWRTAAECIDWSIPCPSIFLTPAEARAVGVKRPLADATMRRIARGVRRYVLDAPQPFIVGVGGRMGQSTERPLTVPYQTITAKGDAALVVPFLVPRYGERDGQEPRTMSVDRPLPVVVPTGNGASIVAAFLAKHYGGHETPGASLELPLSTATTQDHHAVVTVGLDRDTATRGESVRAFLVAYYGNEKDGGSLFDPVRTVTTNDRFGLVTVRGEAYAIVDIGMRMMAPRELFTAQGFPASYRIDIAFNGKPLSKKAQGRMCGNSVCPPLAAAIVRANYVTETITIAA